MLKLKKIGKKGTYHIIGSQYGERIRKSTGTTSEQHAQKLLNDLNRELLDRQVWGETKTSVFAEAVVLYLEQGGEERFVGPLIDEFGSMRMSEITDMKVSAFCSARYPKCGPQGLNRQVYTPLIAIFRRAAKAGICAMPHFQRPIKKRRKTITYAKDEFLAQYLPHCSERLRAASLLLSFTGARASECCRLQSDDVDWEARTALLRETKNGDPRTVVLAPMVYQALIPFRGVAGPLFGLKTRFSLNQAIERACKRAKLQVLTSHEVGRHAFAYRFLKQGGTLKELQEAGGWKSFRIVAETYGHLEKSSVHNAVRNSDNVLASLMAPAENVVNIQAARK